MKRKIGVVPKKKKINFPSVEDSVIMKHLSRKGMLIPRTGMLRKGFPNIFLEITCILKIAFSITPKDA